MRVLESSIIVRIQLMILMLNCHNPVFDLHKGKEPTKLSYPCKDADTHPELVYGLWDAWNSDRMVGAPNV